MVHSAAGIGAAAGRAGRAPAVPGAAPHRVASVSLVGGGSQPLRPGEISLAHGGVLFLDELAGVRADGARRSAPAARRGRGHGGPGRSPAPTLPASVPARRRDEPVPVRRRGRRERASAASARVAPLHAAGVGAAARPVRPARAPCTDRTSTTCSTASRASRRPSSRPASLAARAVAVAAPGRDSTRPRRSSLDAVRATRRAGRRRCCRDEIERDRLTGRGYHRVRRVARTIADLRRTSPSVIDEGDVAMALRLRAALARSTASDVPHERRAALRRPTWLPSPASSG